MTTDNLNLAREWARDNIHGWHFIGSDRALAAAEVIIALPDTIVDGDRLREVVADHHLDMSDELMEALGALLPTSALPTLADMSPVERAECEWMQCDHPALEEPGVILQIWGNGCHVLSREGVVETEALNHVTPRPDLPRMQWPGNEPEEAHVDSPEPAVPRPEDMSETTEQDDVPVFDPPTRFGPYTRITEEETLSDPRDLLKSRQYLDSDGCVWRFRTREGNDRPHWHLRLEGSSDWDSYWYSTPVDGPWTEYKGQD